MSKRIELLIVSDSHGSKDGLRKVLAAHPKADFLLFLGDGLTDLAAVRQTSPCPMVYEVRGNCDFDKSVPADRLITLGGLLVFLTHGDGYQVKLTTQPLRRAAAQRGADLVLFGHTHSPYYAYTDGIYLFNPGSISSPRVGRPTYGLLTIEEGQPDFQHREVPR